MTLEGYRESLEVNIQRQAHPHDLLYAELGAPPTDSKRHLPPSHSYLFLAWCGKIPSLLTDSSMESHGMRIDEKFVWMAICIPSFLAFLNVTHAEKPSADFNVPA